MGENPIGTAGPPLKRMPASRDLEWKTRWVLVGLLLVLGLPFYGALMGARLSAYPQWLSIAATLIAPMAIILVFPLLTRNKVVPVGLAPPKSVRYFRELGVAVLVVFGMIVLLALVGYCYQRIAPGQTLSPEIYQDMPRSQNYLGVGVWMFIAMTLAPIAEEVFFRGFLYNAFRKRMPLLAAIVIQSALFGGAHVHYGVVGMLIVALIGLTLTLVYEWRKTLLTPILVHAGINGYFVLVMTALMFLQANAPVMGVGLEPDACIITMVAEGSGAEAAGLQVGDEIVGFNGEVVEDTRHLLSLVRLCRPGDEVMVVVRRGDDYPTQTVVLQSQEAD